MQPFTLLLVNRQDDKWRYFVPKGCSTAAMEVSLLSGTLVEKATHHVQRNYGVRPAGKCLLMRQRGNTAVFMLIRSNEAPQLARHGKWRTISLDDMTDADIPEPWLGLLRRELKALG